MKKYNLIILILPFFTLFSCNNTKKEANAEILNIEPDVYSLTKNSQKLEDLEYLMGIKIRNLARQNDLATKVEIKYSEIDQKFELETDSLLSVINLSANPKFTRDDMETGIDYTIDDYGLSEQEKLRKKLSDTYSIIDQKRMENKNNIAVKILSDLINKDKSMIVLKNELNELKKSRTKLMKYFEIDKSDSINFFNKRMEYKIDDKLLEGILQN
jgi:hypothetical protein